MFPKHPEAFTKEDKERILTKVVEAMILATFKNPLHKWEERIFLLPNWFESPGSIARMVMDTWLEQMKVKMENSGVPCEMIKKYVDDVLAIVWKLNLGYRWTGDHIEHNP